MSPPRRGFAAWVGGYLKALLQLGTFKYDRGMSENNNMMPAEAIEDAARASFQFMKEEPWEAASPDETDLFKDAARKSLKAAYPILLSHERQQTADAHRDAMVNRDTVDRLEAQLADVWDEGEAAGRQNRAAEEYPSQAVTTNPYRSDNDQ